MIENYQYVEREGRAQTAARVSGVDRCSWAKSRALGLPSEASESAPHQHWSQGLSVRRAPPFLQPPQLSWLRGKRPESHARQGPQLSSCSTGHSGAWALPGTQELEPRGGPRVPLRKPGEQLPRVQALGLWPVGSLSHGDTQLCPPRSRAHPGSLQEEAFEGT